MHSKAIFPLFKLNPKTQKDFATLHLCEHLMIESLNNSWQTDLVTQAQNTYCFEISANISRNEIMFNLEYLKEFEEVALSYFNKVINNPNYNLNFIENIKDELIDELLADNDIIKLSDKFFRENFTSYHKFRDGGTIKTIEKITEKDVIYWLKRIQNCSYYWIKDDGQIQVVEREQANQNIEQLTIKDCLPKCHLPQTKTVTLDKLDRIATFHIDSCIVKPETVIGLEKYLRDKYQQIIDVRRRVLTDRNSKICIISLYYYKHKIAYNEVEKDLEKFLDNPPKEYINFGTRKHQAVYKVDGDYRLRRVWDKIFC